MLSELLLDLSQSLSWIVLSLLDEGITITSKALHILNVYQETRTFRNQINFFHFFLYSPNKDYYVNVLIFNIIIYMQINSQKDYCGIKIISIIRWLHHRLNNGSKRDFYRLQIAGKCSILFKMNRSKDHRAIVMISATRQREIES